MIGPSRSGRSGQVHLDGGQVAHVRAWRLWELALVRGYRTSSSAQQPRQAPGGRDWLARIECLVPLEGAMLPPPGAAVKLDLLEAPGEGWSGSARVVAVRTALRIGPRRPVNVTLELAGCGALVAVSGG